MSQDLWRGAVLAGVLVGWGGWTSSWPEPTADAVEVVAQAASGDVRAACGPLVQRLGEWGGPAYAQRLGEKVRSTMSGNDVVAMCLSLREADREAVFAGFEELGREVP